MPTRPLYTGSSYEVSAYVRNNDSCPVEEYLNGLPERDRKRFTALFDRSANDKPPRNKEKCRKVAGEDFWEFKAHQQRIFWCYDPGRRNQIVLLHGFTKKSTQTPKRELATGRQVYHEAQQELSLGG